MLILLYCIHCTKFVTPIFSKICGLFKIIQQFLIIDALSNILMCMCFDFVFLLEPFYPKITKKNS